MKKVTVTIRRGETGDDLQQKLEGVTRFLQLADQKKALAPALYDLLTPAEISQIHERVQILDCLEKGLSQREVVKKTGAAIATVSRGSRKIQSPEYSLSSILKTTGRLSWWNTFMWRP